MVPCFRPALEYAFTKEKNVLGWAIEGFIPFTRAPFWKKIAADAAAASRSSMSASTRFSSLSTPSHDDGASAEQPFQPIQAGQPAPAEQHPEQQPVPQVPIPVDIQDTLRQVTSAFRASAGSGSIDVTDLLTENLKFKEHLRVLTDFVNTVAQPAPVAPAPGTTGRITSKNIWGLPGSATGAEAMEMRIQIEEEKKRKEAEDNRKRDEREAKRRRNIANLVSQGSTILETLRLNGPAAISRLSVTELQAVIQNSNPQKGVPKGNKAQLVAVVEGLQTVRAALQDFAAAAAREATRAALAAALAQQPLIHASLPTGVAPVVSSSDSVDGGATANSPNSTLLSTVRSDAAQDDPVS